MQATDRLKTPDTVLSTLHGLSHLILQPCEVGTAITPNLHMGKLRHIEVNSLSRVTQIVGGGSLKVLHCP